MFILYIIFGAWKYPLLHILASYHPWHKIYKHHVLHMISSYTTYNIFVMFLVLVLVFLHSPSFYSNHVCAFVLTFVQPPIMFMFLSLIQFFLVLAPDLFPFFWIQLLFVSMSQFLIKLTHTQHSDYNRVGSERYTPLLHLENNFAPVSQSWQTRAWFSICFLSFRPYIRR